MGFDLDALRQAANKYGPIARVVVADVAGSTPRDIGASMLVWKTGQSGTIGGGALEYQAARTAREAIEQGKTSALFSRHPLGPDLGQCCGGSVTLVTEFFSTQSMPKADGNLLIRRITGASTLPFSAKRVLADHRGQGVLPKPGLYDGWMIEPVFAPSAQLWIWGAGHVGRALVHMFAPLPDLEITWVDTGSFALSRLRSGTGNYAACKNPNRADQACTPNGTASYPDIFAQFGLRIMQWVAAARV